MSTKLRSNPLKSCYNYVKELEEILSSLEHLLSYGKELGLKVAGRNRSRRSERHTPVADASDFCGREDIKETIIQSLRSADVRGEKKRAVIPIIGAGGIGKTTLAQIIYHHPEVEQLFGIVRAWVTISTEFDLPAIIKNIIGQISDSSQIDSNVDQMVLQFKLRDALKGKRFLLVLDDVWSEVSDGWNILKSCLQSGERGSKIIVTTRSAKVASIMAPNRQHHYFLQELPEKDCWKLFAQTVFDDDEDRDADPDLQKLGEKIVRKCKGNPLSVVTVGGILRGERDPEKWEKILENSLWELLQKENKSIIPSLWLSYIYLPSQIKPCFAYCSIFPKDHPFQKEEVVRLWMAEGFLKNGLKNGAGKTVEEVEVGKEYFEELISRSLFQRSEVWGRRVCFIMHDLVHDLAMKVSGEFCFCLEGEKKLRDLSCKTRYLSCDMQIQDVKNSEDLSKARRLHSIVGLIRPFSLIPSNRELGILKVLAEVSVEVACLRVLSLSHYKIDSLRDSLGKLKQLRYLDLSYSNVRELPEICTLFNLQTLLLAGCENLTQLPESIGNLEQLRYLDLHDSGVRELPDSIGTLDNLQTLLLACCANLTQLPESIGNLKKLRYLDLYDSGVREVPDSIGTLDNLQTLLLECCANSTLLPTNQGSLINLHRLNIGYSPKLEFLGNCRYGSLKDLKIESCEALKWIRLDYFPKLKTLDLKELECLVELKGESADELKELSIEECPRLEYLGNCRYGSLKVLKIVKCKALKSIPVDYFPKLTELTLRYCQNFESFRFAEEPPLVLESLSFLELKGLPKFVSFPEGGFPAPNLKHFHIYDCENLRSLPQQMHRLLEIRIFNCGEIESWPEGGLPSNLESLKIWGCKKLAAQVMHWDLQVPCLKILKIDGCGEELLDSFPPEGLLPTSLTSLWIGGFRRLKTLNIHVFQHLDELCVFDCDELQCLPEESLPDSLSSLEIYKCPLLEQQYRKETGEGWHKISHIPSVRIDHIDQHGEYDEVDGLHQLLNFYNPPFPKAAPNLH